MPQTNERAFETDVEESLLTRGGWKSGSNAEWDKERALPETSFAVHHAAGRGGGVKVFTMARNL